MFIKLYNILGPWVDWGFEVYHIANLLLTRDHVEGMGGLSAWEGNSRVGNEARWGFIIVIEPMLALGTLRFITLVIIFQKRVTILKIWAAALAADLPGIEVHESSAKSEVTISFQYL